MKHLRLSSPAILLFVLISFLAVPLAAQRQSAESAKLDVVDAPTLGAGAFELEFGYQFSREDRHRSDQDILAHSAGTTSLTASYGAGEHFDLAFAVCWCDRNEVPDLAAGKVQESGAGLGDGALGMKWRAWRSADGAWEGALLGTVAFPLDLAAGVGSLRPGEGIWNVLSGAALTYSAKRLSVSANVLGFFPLEGDAIVPEYMVSTAAGMQVDEHVQPVMEISVVRVGWSAESSVSFSLGAVFTLAEHLRLTAGLRQHRHMDGTAEMNHGFLRMAAGI